MATAVEGRVEIEKGVYLNPGIDFGYSEEEIAWLKSLRQKAEDLLVRNGSPDYPHFGTLKGLPEALPALIREKIVQEPNWLRKFTWLKALLIDFPLFLKPKFSARIKEAQSSAFRLLLLSHYQENLRLFSTPRADQDRRPADLLMMDFRIGDVRRIAQRAGLRVPELPWVSDKVEAEERAVWQQWDEGLADLGQNGWKGQVREWPIAIESSRFRSDLPAGRGAIRTFLCLEPAETAALSHILMIRSPEEGIPLLKPIDPRNLLVLVSTSHGLMLGQDRDLGFIPWTQRSLLVAQGMLDTFSRNIDLTRSQTESAISYNSHTPGV